MVSTLHFSGWNFMNHFYSHSACLSRSCWRFAASGSDDIVTYAMVSSANSRTVDWIPSGMSFIKNKNKLSPRTDHWGTPDSTGMEVDVSPPTTTDCPVTEEVLNPLICFPCDPIMFQLMNDKAMADLIKSFGKSIMRQSVCFPWSRFLVTSSINSISCDSQDNPLWNPCWSGYMMFCVFAWDIIWLVMICSMSLHETQVRDTGL